MSKGFNYSRWDKIELSDDESDVHPNIDKDSWFRLKHRTRLEREEKEDDEIIKINQLNSEDQTRINIITARLNGIKSGQVDEDAEFEDLDALKDEREELLKNIENRNKRVADIKERRLWNIDNICKVKEEKTVVNSPHIASLKADDYTPTGATEAVFAKRDQEIKAKATNLDSTITTTSPDTITTTANPSSIATVSPASSTTTLTSIATASPTAPTTVFQQPQPLPSTVSTTKSREKFSMISYNDYVLQHEELLEKFSVITDLEASQKFLFQHCDILLHDHAQSYLLLSCLEDEMNGKKERMKLVCRQSQILSHITELGTQMNRDPRDVILPFFKRLEEKQYLTGELHRIAICMHMLIILTLYYMYTGFSQAVDEFRGRIVERAKVRILYCDLSPT